MPKYETYYGIFEKDTDKGEETGHLNGPFGLVPDEIEAGRVAKAMFGKLGVARPTSPSNMEQWGYGKGDLDREGNVKPPFEQVRIGTMENGRWVGLTHGEHPHSRSNTNYYTITKDGDTERFSGHRLMHEITFEDQNYLKESYYSGDEVRKSGTCTIKINGHVCEVFNYRDVTYALQQVQAKLTRIHDFGACQLWNPEDRQKLVGRKIYWYNTPAVITSFMEDQACVMLKIDESVKPDAEGRRCFPESPCQQNDKAEALAQERKYYENEDRMFDESGFEEIKDTIFSKNIWWWRG